MPPLLLCRFAGKTPSSIDVVAALSTDGDCRFAGKTPSAINVMAALSTVCVLAVSHTGVSGTGLVQIPERGVSGE